MEWPIILALVLAIPIILFPLAFVSYLNVGAVRAAISESRQKKAARKPARKARKAVAKRSSAPVSTAARLGRLGLFAAIPVVVYALAIFFALANLGWEVALALGLALPVVFVPLGLIWYVNVAGVHWIIHEARERQRRRAEVLREAMSILTMAEDRPTIGVATGEGDFWASKTPCWKMCSCAAQIREECPAFTAKSALPCWETEGTFCKLTAEGDEASGRDTTICQVCPVYLKYGAGRPIQLKPARLPVAVTGR